MKASKVSIRSFDQPRVALSRADRVMRNLLFFLLGLALMLLLGLVASEPAAAAPQTKCAVQLTVELTPDVPDSSDDGFLSSLLNNHPGYRLELLRVIDPALLELELSGPGPGYRCVGVIDTIRKDGRVLSVHTNTDEMQSSINTSVSGTGAELPHLRSTGVGSLYWAARHPSQAWRVVLPIRSGEKRWEDALKESEIPPS